MTVILKTMNSDEFRQYLDYAIENFANEQIKSGNWKQEGANSKAAEEHKRLLPDGPNTDNNYLFTILDGDLKVGMVWLAKKDDNKGFIYDINIWKGNQGKGYGKQAMKQVEIIAKEIGLKMIGLHVFGYNKVARGLYEQLGYVETNIKMEKSL
ncbi:GNAT family N-acetyltransferase [Virgibacillus necropolis]|uniref:GNAT family N-acetyltransferase n=1 Tax=Virgibacillus necropolis TaxID=163877 RepID=UPI003850A63E